MKNVVLLALALVLTVSTVAMAVHTEILGTITSIDPVAQQIVVNDVTIQLTESTVIWMKGAEITFADLEIGMPVKAVGDLCNDVLAATRITVRVGECDAESSLPAPGEETE